MDATFEVMIVSDDSTVAGFFSAWVQSQEGAAVVIERVENAVRRFRAERPEFVVLDVGSTAGLGALEQFRSIDRDVPIVAVSAQHSPARVVEAMRLGAAEVVSAPFNAPEVDAALGSALRQRRFKRDMAAMQHEVRAQSKHTMLFGSGHAMGELRTLIDRVVDTDVTVLIRGESGTGKELVARALAASTLRRGKPFIKINCAALPGELFEAELFGFERGAFTGAIQGKPGKFEMANGGTIFLDEVGEIPLHLQSKLLQVLEGGHFSRLGSQGDIQAIVRVIAATNRDLDDAVLAGRFRADLLFRLNVIPMFIPPLRERIGDVPLLAEFFLKRWAVFYNRRYAPMSSGMMQECVEYGWPGNIRQLENVIKRYVILGDEASIRKDIGPRFTAGRSARPNHRPPVAEVVVVAVPAVSVGSSNSAAVDQQTSLKEVSRKAARGAERVLIQKMLERTRWHLNETARNLGISYKALAYKIKENGLLTGSPARRQRAGPAIGGPATAGDTGAGGSERSE